MAAKSNVYHTHYLVLISEFPQMSGTLIAAIRHITISIYCRSTPVNGSKPIIIRELRHFMHFPYVVGEVQELCFLSNCVPEIKNAELAKIKIAMDYSFAYPVYKTPTPNNRYEFTGTINILSKYKKKDMHLFLDYLMKDLDHEKIMTMKESHFQIVFGIFRELCISDEHPLYASLFFRLINKALELILSEPLVKLIAEYAIKINLKED